MFHCLDLQRTNLMSATPFPPYFYVQFMWPKDLETLWCTTLLTKEEITTSFVVIPPYYRLEMLQYLTSCVTVWPRSVIILALNLYCHVSHVATTNHPSVFSSLWLSVFDSWLPQANHLCNTVDAKFYSSRFTFVAVLPSELQMWARGQRWAASSTFAAGNRLLCTVSTEIQPDILSPPLLRLTSRKPLWLDLQPVDIKSRWRQNWKSAQVVNSSILT